MGVIDTITAGFRLVTRRIWLLVLPLALDLFLLFGPKLSMRPVMQDMLDSMILPTLESMTDTGVQMTTGELTATAQELVDDVLGRLNLFGVMARSELGFPSAASSRAIDLASDTVYEISSGMQLVMDEIGLLGLGLLLATAFLIQVSSAVSPQQRSFGGLVHYIAKTWLRFLVILVPLVFALSLAIVLLSAMPDIIGVMLMMVFSVAVVWVLIYLAFVPQAMVQANLSPLAAISSSFVLVRRFFLPSLGMLFLTFILRAGFSYIWGQLVVASDILALVALVGSAYIGTALTAALFIFFRERNLVRVEQPKGVQYS